MNPKLWFIMTFEVFEKIKSKGFHKIAWKPYKNLNDEVFCGAFFQKSDRFPSSILN